MSSQPGRFPTRQIQAIYSPTRRRDEQESRHRGRKTAAVTQMMMFPLICFTEIMENRIPDDHFKGKTTLLRHSFGERALVKIPELFYPRGERHRSWSRDLLPTGGCIYDHPSRLLRRSRTFPAALLCVCFGFPVYSCGMPRERIPTCTFRYAAMRLRHNSLTPPSSAVPERRPGYSH